MTNKTVHLVATSPFDGFLRQGKLEDDTKALLHMKKITERLGKQPRFAATGRSALRFQSIKMADKALYREIKNLIIREKRLSIVGGAVEDTEWSVPGLESGIRQYLYGQSFFEGNFGRKCETGFCLTSGNYHAMMPQILKKSKMLRVVLGCEKIHSFEEASLFWWEAPDHSRVLVYAVPMNWMEQNKTELEKDLNKTIQSAKSQKHGMMLLFDSENQQKLYQTLSLICDRLPAGSATFSSVDSFFDTIISTRVDLPVYRGSIDSSSAKANSPFAALNRKAEAALYSAEIWDTLASFFMRDTPSKKIPQGWISLLEAQTARNFSANLSSDEKITAQGLFGAAINQANQVKSTAVLKLTGGISTESKSELTKDGQPVVVFHSHAFSSKAVVELPEAFEKCLDENGQPIFCAVDEAGHTHLSVSSKALGYRTYYLFKDADATQKVKSPLRLGKGTIENQSLKIEFDRNTGLISGFIKKSSKKNFCNGENFCVPVILSPDGKKTPFVCDKFELIENIKARIKLHVRYRAENAEMNCNFILNPFAEELRMEISLSTCGVKGRILLPFPLGGAMGEFAYEIQGCCQKSPANGQLVTAMRWADFSSLDENGLVGGITIICNEKSIYTCEDGVLSLVLFDSEKSEGETEDLELAIYPHDGAFQIARAVQAAESFSSPDLAVLTDCHKGELPASQDLIRLDKENIVVSAVKFCEDGSNSLILRMRETEGASNTRVAIMGRPLNFAFYSDFGPYEIKTFRMEANGMVSDVDLLEDANIRF